MQMCDGLGKLHEHHIIHRDIKPSNMILQGDRIRLIDFDAARIFKPGQENDTKILGTRGYAPPEQFGSGQTDPRSDIYALGITMKILLGGQCGGLKKILDRCTELDPKNRFQNVDELKSALTNDKPRRKIFPPLIFVTVVGIFLLATISPLHRAEFSPEEKISTPQKISTAAEENISAPAQTETFNLPTISPSTPISTEPSTPQKFSSPAQTETFTPPTISPSTQNLSGLLKTEFYLNGVAYYQHEHRGERTQISRVEWPQSRVSLHIINDTGNPWKSPTIKFTLGQNWGDKFNDTKTLPTLAAGESADFEIPFALFTISDRPDTLAYVQIYLDGDERKMDEHYWAIWFEIVD